MFGSSALDVAIGLAFLYLLLSLICTALNELIEAIIRRRGTYLMEGVQELLGGPTAQALLAQVYGHPFVASLYSGTFGTNARLPSYIPSRQFALALLDLVLPASAIQKSGAALAATGGRADFISASRQVKALRDAVAASGALTGNVKAALLALIDASGDDLERIRDNIEKWYEGTMDRVAGWYRRHLVRISVAVGTVLVVCLNADTFAIADSLARDQTLRTSVAAAAESYVKNAPANPNPKEQDESAKDRIREVAKRVNEAKAFGWPLGWDRSDPRTIPRIDDKVDDPYAAFWRAVGAWLLKLLGWALTAIAVSMGAPFWFDLLNRMVAVRSTMKPKDGAHS
jgi:hypothetical protein